MAEVLTDVHAYILQTSIISPTQARWTDHCAIEAVTDSEARVRAVNVAAELFREQAGEAVLRDWSGRVVWSHRGTAAALLPGGSATADRAFV